MSLLLLSLACTGQSALPDTEPAPSEALARLPDCAAYAGDATAFEFCAYQSVGREPTLQGAREICALSGPWESDCAESWAASGQHCELPLEELLDLCPQETCRFAVLDTCPSGEVLAQIDLCEAHAGRFARDCVGHALQRWLMAQPTGDEAGQLMARSSYNASVIGAWAGLGMARLGEGTCEDPPGDYEVTAGNVEWCKNSLQRCEEDPDWCSRHWTQGPRR